MKKITRIQLGISFLTTVKQLNDDRLTGLAQFLMGMAIALSIYSHSSSPIVAELIAHFGFTFTQIFVDLMMLIGIWQILFGKRTTLSYYYLLTSSPIIFYMLFSAYYTVFINPTTFLRPVNARDFFIIVFLIKNLLWKLGIEFAQDIQNKRDILLDKINREELEKLEELERSKEQQKTVQSSDQKSDENVPDEGNDFFQSLTTDVLEMKKTLEGNQSKEDSG